MRGESERVPATNLGPLKIRIGKSFSHTGSPGLSWQKAVKKLLFCVTDSLETTGVFTFDHCNIFVLTMYSDISVLKFISVLVSISFSVNHFYFYIISVLT